MGYQAPNAGGVAALLTKKTWNRNLHRKAGDGIRPMIIPGPDNPSFRVMRGLFYSWIVLLVLSLYPYTEDPATPIKLLISGGAALLITGVWAVGTVRQTLSIRPVGIQASLLVALLGVLSLSALFSVSPARSLHALLPLVIAATLALHAQQLFSHPRHLRNLFRVIVGAVAVASVYGIAQYLGIDPFPWTLQRGEEYRGLPATYGHPNFAGHALVIAITLCGGLIVDAWHRKNKRHVLLVYLPVLLLLMTHLYLTHMRGGVVALALSLLAVGVTLCLRCRWTPRAAWLTGLVAVALVLGAGVAVVLLRPALLPLDNSLQLRLHAYGGASAIFLDHWLLGVGPGNYTFFSIPTWSTFESLWYALEGKRNHHVHNEWLEFAVEGGIPALFLLILLFLHGLYAPFARPAERAVLRYTLPVALLAVAVDGCFGFNLHVPVSGALIVVFLGLQADGTERWLRPGPPMRVGAVLLVALVGFYSLEAWWNFTAERRYQQGQGALAWMAEHGDISVDERLQLDNTAQRLFLEAQRKAPWDFRHPMALGSLALDQGHGAEAVVFFESALRLHPHLPRLQLGLARACLQQASTVTGTARTTTLNRAEELARGVISACPELGDAYTVLGWRYWLGLPEGEDASARTQARLAMEAFAKARLHGVTHDPEMEYVMALSAQRADEHEESVLALRRAITLDPGVERYWARFEELASTGSADVMAPYRQTLLFHLSEAEPMSAPLRATLAHRLVHISQTMGSTDVARQCLDRMLLRYPEADPLWAAWVATLPAATAVGEFVSRQDAIEAGTHVGPVASAIYAILGNPSAVDIDWDALSSLAITPPRPAGEKEEHKHLTPLFGLLPPMELPAGGDALQRGRLAFAATNYREAEALFREAARTLPGAQHGELSYFLSRTLAHRKQPAAALALAREALQRDHDSLFYQWNFALRLAEVGDYAAARFQLETLLPQMSQRPDYQEAVRGVLANLPDGARP